MGTTRWRGSVAATCLAAVVLLGFPAPTVAAGGDSAPTVAAGGDAAPDYLQGPGRSGHSSDDRLAPPLIRRWTHNFDNQLTYPLIAGDRVFVGVVSTGGSDPAAYGDRIVALSLRTGGVLWQTEIPGPYYTAMLAYDAGRVFVVNWNGVVEAMSASSGRVLWQTKAPGDHYSDPPVALGGTVYLVSPTYSRLDALNERTGYFRWQVPAATCGASIAVGGGRVYLDGCGHAAAYAARTGALLWQRARGSANAATGVTDLGAELATNDGSVISGSGMTRSELVSAAAGARRGTFPYSFHPPVVAGSLLISTPLDATYLEGIQVRGQPGERRWSHPTQGQFGQPLVVGRDVFVLDNSHLEAYDAATGERRGSFPVPSGQAHVQNQLPPAAMASAEGYLVVPDESALSVYTARYNPPDRGVRMGASPRVIVYGTGEPILVQGRLGADLRRRGSTAIVLSARGFSEPQRELARRRSFADGGFEFELAPPGRDTRYDVASAHGSAAPGQTEVFVYPSSRYSYASDRRTGMTTATVRLTFAPGIRLIGQTGFLYLERVSQGTLERLGHARISGNGGHGMLSVSFRRPADAGQHDRILWCVHRMTRLGLGYPDVVDARCGQASIRYP